MKERKKERMKERKNERKKERKNERKKEIILTGKATFFRGMVSFFIGVL